VDSKGSEGIDSFAEDWNCVASGEDSRPQHHTIIDKSWANVNSETDGTRIE
jgi:hypothetical protein